MTSWRSIGVAVGFGLAIILLATSAQWVFAAQAVFQAESNVPYWVLIIIILFGFLIATALTVIAGVMYKRINRANQDPPIQAKPMAMFTLKAGFFLGLVCQFTFQKVASYITGVPVFLEMLVGVPVITGLAAMGLYEFLLVRWKERRPKMYAKIRVRHIPGIHNCGNNPKDHLNEDDTKFYVQHDETVRMPKKEYTGDDSTEER